MKKPTLRIAITPGAENGVGPELLLGALKSYKYRDDISFFWCGDAHSLLIAAQHAGIPIRFFGQSACLDEGPHLTFFNDMAGSLLERQAAFLKKSVELAQEKAIDAIVTGPIDKASLKFLDEGTHPGQTEYFARHLAMQTTSEGGAYKEIHDELSEEFNQEDGVLRQPLMVFMGGPFLLSLLTGHMPLVSIGPSLAINTVTTHIESVAHYQSLISKKDSKTVKIVVLGLNPHAGEHGLIGHEEKDIIIPALSIMEKRGFNVHGPVPADGFFAYLHLQPAHEIPDIVIAAYHDQGLIPYKLLTKGSAVNVTLGLKVPRVSPAHGTAYELAHKNIACPTSTQMAIKTAVDLANH